MEQLLPNDCAIVAHVFESNNLVKKQIINVGEMDKILPSIGKL